jgi:hypothetical protein
MPAPTCTDCAADAPVVCIGCLESLCADCYAAWGGSLDGLCLRCGSERIDAEAA